MTSRASPYTLSGVSRFVDSDFGVDPYFERYLRAGRVACTERQVEYMFRILWPLLAQYRRFIVAQKAMVTYTALAPVAPGDRDGEYNGPGHVLLEDFPGKGKTFLGGIPAAVLGGTFGRFQGAADNTGSDYLGFTEPYVDEQGNRLFRFKQGPAFSDIQLIDEVNRNSERMQGAFLSVLGEGKIMVGGKTTHKVPFAILTMNPIEHEGVVPLIPALADRIMFKVRGQWLTADDFSEIDERSIQFTELRRHLKQVCSFPTVHEIRDFVLREIHLDDELRRKMGRFSEVSNDTSRAGCLKKYSDQVGGKSIIVSGLWGRGFTHWTGAARAMAMFRYRDHVLPQDAYKVLLSILRHRVVFGDGILNRFKNIYGDATQADTVDRILTDLIKEAF